MNGFKNEEEKAFQMAQNSQRYQYGLVWYRYTLLLLLLSLWYQYQLVWYRGIGTTLVLPLLSPSVLVPIIVVPVPLCKNSRINYFLDFNVHSLLVLLQIPPKLTCACSIAY